MIPIPSPSVSRLVSAQSTLGARFCALLSALFPVVAAGCADPIFVPMDAATMDVSTVEDSGPGIPPRSGAFAHEETETEVTTRADATDHETWQYLDLDTGVSTDDPERWDLAFRRFFIRVNGGVSGPGGVSLAPLSEGENNFASIMEAPTEGWVTAVEDGPDDDDQEADTLFNNGSDDWYAYEFETHTLSAKDRVTAVRSTEGRFYKFQMLGYYDDAGTPANVRFQWAEIMGGDVMLPDAGPFDGGMPMDAGPDSPDAFMIPSDAETVTASDGVRWTYYHIASGETYAEEPASGAWDLAFRRSQVRTNSGSSGDGLGGALAVEQFYTEVTSTDTYGLAIDRVIDTGAPGAQPTSLSPVLTRWYDYDPRIHVLTPKELTYIVRLADGGYAKMRIWDWEDGVYTASFEIITHHAEVHEVTLDLEAGAWVPLELAGATLHDEEVAVSWTPAELTVPADLAAQGLRWRSHGGAHPDAAMAAVCEGQDIALDALSATDCTLIEDASITTDGDSYVGSTPLQGWPVDPAAEPIEARPLTYVVRTHAGHFAAFRIGAYSAAAYTLQVRYAGPGQSSFQ